MLDLIDPILLNFVYTAQGGLLTIWFMKLGCHSFNKIVSFNISDELAKGNLAGWDDGCGDVHRHWHRLRTGHRPGIELNHFGALTRVCHYGEQALE
jgi:hypothetical protein